MSRIVDVLVLGGGPAGSTVAALCASAGLRVTLVERSRFPRDKVCGEFVSGEGCAVLDRLGLLRTLIDAGATPLSTGRITSAAGTVLDFALPRVSGSCTALGVSRAHLDSELLDLARLRGARVLERTEALAPELVDGKVRGMRVRAVGKRNERRIEARLVVAADGRRSVLARALHPALGDPRRTHADSWFGLGTHLASDSRALDGCVELHLFDGGYCGLAPIEGERVNACLLTTVRALREAGGSPDRLFHERIVPLPGVGVSLGRTRPVRRWTSVGPLRFGVRRPTAAGALFVGDAAGTIDPFCGEGISNALCAAEIAAAHAVEAATRGGLDRRLAAAYRRRWTRDFGPVTRRVRWQGRLFEHARIAELAFRLLSGVAHRVLPRLVAASRTGHGG